MELTVRGQGTQSEWPEPKPTISVSVGHDRSVYVLCDFVFINHRTNRKERIVGAELHLKRRHLLFWKKTLFKAPITRYSTHNDRTPFGELELEPMSRPTPVTIMVSAQMSKEVVRSLPKRFDMVAVFYLPRLA